jgi:hypothetical protein
VAREAHRDWLTLVESVEAEEQWTLLCFLASRSVALDEAAVNGALRRAELLLASGGDPHRRLELFGRAVTSVAQDLDTPERRDQLRSALERLQAETAGLRAANEALRLLLRDDDLAWQCLAMALLAEELADESVT